MAKSLKRANSLLIPPNSEREITSHFTFRAVNLLVILSVSSDFTVFPDVAGVRNNHQWTITSDLNAELLSDLTMPFRALE